jgi:hypothetical protein
LHRESVLVGDIVFVENVQNPACAAYSNGAYSWKAMSKCMYAAHAESRNLSYLHCRRTNANSVRDRMASYFAFASKFPRLKESIIKRKQWKIYNYVKYQTEKDGNNTKRQKYLYIFCFIVASQCMIAPYDRGTLYYVHGHVDGLILSLNCDHQQDLCSSPRWYMRIQSRWKDNGRVNRGTRKKTGPVPLPIKHSIWTDFGTNPGLHGERPATNLLNRVTAEVYYVFNLIKWVYKRSRLYKAEKLYVT